MNMEMAYLMGMIYGNGEIARSSSSTIVVINIPHKKLQTEEIHDVKLYVKASIADIRRILEPLINSPIKFIQNKSITVLSFEKPNEDYLIREINRFTNLASSHNNMRINKELFNCTYDEKKQLIKGFADVTGYIRRSNYYLSGKYQHRVYLEISNNWEMVVDMCNLLKTIDIPVQNIDWAHPNIRDGHLKKYNEGKKTFWKKEHQVKIWANEFTKIGFGIIHKQQALEMFSEELLAGYKSTGKEVTMYTHRYYWETRKTRKKEKPSHPCENDPFIPEQIRGKHFNTWTEIASMLGYDKY